MGSFVGNVGGSDRCAGRGGVRALVWERVRAVLQQRKYWHWYENMNACKCYARCPCQEPACMCECAQRQQHFS
ncbi:hypothetical protein HMPREF3190_01359 [Umbribacter vaginalis]|nr:hypothetical protein HMPREF3190_01359 [Coriobacteriales bacterium DNF00809]